MIERFADKENGGFFETSSDHEQLVARRKDLEDHLIPAGNSSAAYGLLRLAALTGEQAYAERAESVLRLLHELGTKHLQAFGHLLQALDFRLAREGGGRRRSARAAGARGPRLVPPAPRARGRRARRRAAAQGRDPVEGQADGVRVRRYGLPRAGHRAERARGAPGGSSGVAAALAAAAGVTAAPRDERERRSRRCASWRDAHRVAVRIASWGLRLAASEPEACAHRLMARVFRRAGLHVGVQDFRVPGRGRSRNLIGVYQTPRSCLRIVMAHTDSMPEGPGANDNAWPGSWPLAGRLRLIDPWCDVWLVATGAEERLYTGSPDHLGARALAARARPRGGRDRLRFALADEVGRDRPFWLRPPRSAPRPKVEGALLAAASRVGVPVSWVRDESTGNSDHREFELIGLPGAKLGVGAGGEPRRHMARDRRGAAGPQVTGPGPAHGGRGTARPLISYSRATNSRLRASDDGHQTRGLIKSTSAGPARCARGTCRAVPRTQPRSRSR